MAAIWFKATLRHTADIEGLWAHIPHNHVSLGGEDKHYTILYTGDAEEGLRVLEQVVREGHCKVQMTCGY